MSKHTAHAIGATARAVHEFLAESAERFPDRVAIKFNGATIAYRDLMMSVRRVAKSFRERGIGRGQQVGLLMPNHPAFIVVYYAALVSGATVVCLNPLYAEPALREMAADAELSLVAILDSDELRTKAEAISCTCGAEILFAIRLVGNSSAQRTLKNR